MRNPEKRVVKRHSQSADYLMAHYVFGFFFLVPSTLGIGWVVYLWTEWGSWKRTTGQVIYNEKMDDGEHPFHATAEVAIGDQVHRVVSDVGRAAPHKIGDVVIIIYPPGDLSKARFYYASQLSFLLILCAFIWCIGLLSLLAPDMPPSTGPVGASSSSP